MATGSPAGRDGDDAPVGDAEARAALAELLAAKSFRASPRRRRLLAYLVERTLDGHADRLKAYDIATAVLSRGEGFDPVNDPIVRIEAGRLRRDLDGHYEGAGRSDAVRITIPKGHYVPTFARVAAPAAEVGPLPAAPSVPSVPKRRAWLAAVLALLVVLFAVAAWRPQPWWQADGTRLAGPALIVRPFAPVTGDEGGRLLAAGLTGELVADLMRFPGLQVYAGVAAEGPVAMPAAAAGAPAFIVGGTVQRDTDRVRVDAQLTEHATGRVLWSERYDRALTTGNLFEVEAEVTGAIVARLASAYGVIGEATARALRRTRPASLFAYDCVQRAYAYRRTFASEQYPAVRDCLDETLRRDPEDADAWAMRALIHIDAARFARVPAAEAPVELAAALAAARKAVDLAPDSMRSVQALATVQMVSGMHDDSIASQRRGVDLNPNDPESLAQLGLRLVAAGRAAEAVVYLEQAIARSVVVPNWYYVTLAGSLYLDGRSDEALIVARKGVGPCCGNGYAILAIVAAAAGERTEAAEALAEALRQAPILVKDPRAFFTTQGMSVDVAERVVAGLAKAGLQLPPPSGS